MARATRWSLPVLASCALPVCPAFAGVAEREPPVTVLWLTLATIAGLSLIMACRRWWLPLMLWLPVAFVASLIVADLADPVIGAAVREELGALYLFQTDLCLAMAITVPLLFASLRFTPQT